MVEWYQEQRKGSRSLWLIRAATAATSAARKRRKGSSMKTEALQRVMEQAEELDIAAQQTLAAQFQQVLDEFLADLAWERTLSSPEGLATLERLTQEAREEVARGEVYDLDEIL